MIDELKAKAVNTRKLLIKLHGRAKTSHIGSSLSSVEILIALFFRIIDLEKDKFILSKGHGVSALYVTLSMIGQIPKDYLDLYAVDGGMLHCHPDSIKVPQVFTSTGSLGHGLSIGTGYGLGKKLDKEEGKVFILLSDGEMQEGAVWEAAHVAARLKLDNIIAIVDANKIQAFERTENIMPVSTFKDKWKSFGWAVKEIDGHNFESIINSLKTLPFKKGKPSIIICDTVKGKGVKSFEDKLQWHYRSPPVEDIDRYVSEIDTK